MISNPPQGKSAIPRCSLPTEEADFITNSLPQAGLVDTLTRSESIQLAFYTSNDVLIRSESIQLGFYASTDVLIRSESMSFVNT